MKKYSIILIFIILIMAGCAQQDYPIAKIGNQYFYKSQFEKLFINVVNKDMTEEQLRNRADSVYINTINQFTVYEYQKKNDQLSDNIKKIIKNSKNNYYIQAVYKKLITDKLKISDKEAHEAYIREKTTVWAQHILVDEKSLADSLYKILKKNPEKFGELAKEFSTDSLSSKNEGKLKPFAGGKMIKVFEDACMKQPIGIIGKPIESIFGYHIIRVNRREQKDTSNYDADIESVKNNLKKKKTRKLEEESVKLLQDRTHLVIFEDNVDSLIKYAKFDRLRDIITDSLPENIKTLTLCKSKFGTWNILDIIEKKNENGMGYINLQNRRNFEDFMKKMMFYLELFDYGKKLKGHISTEEEKEIMLKTIIYAHQDYIKNLKNEIAKDDSTIMEYYKKNIDEYSEKAKAGIYIICNKDSAKVALIMDSLKMNKKSFEEYSRLYSIIKPKEFQKPRYHWKTEDDTLGYFEMAQSIKLGEISPIFKNKLGYNIIKVEEFIPAQAKEFDKIKNTVKFNYERYVIDSLVKENGKFARKDIGYKFYEKKYNQMLNEIINKIKKEMK